MRGAVLCQEALGRARRGVRWPGRPGSALAAPSLSFPMRKTGLMIPTSCRAVRKLGVAKS